MNTNLSLMNPGTSMNFDGQVLQNAQEEECRQEEEQQQNELKQLLTNAFDDLIDDDEFSVTSDEGGPSTNASLHMAPKAESAGEMVDKDTQDGPFLDDRGQWTPAAYQGIAPTAIPPQSLATIYEASSVRNSQEISVRGSHDLLRSSLEDFNVRGSRDQPLRSSQDLRDEHLRSSQDFRTDLQRRSQDFNEEPLQSLQDFRDEPLRRSKDFRDEPLRSSQDFRGDSLRRSQELLYGNQPGSQDYLHAGAGPQNTVDDFHSDGYHSNSEQDSATPSYNVNPQAFDWINQATQDGHVNQQPSLGVQGGYMDYPGGQLPTRYPDMPVRQETEGGNMNIPPLTDSQAYLPQPGYYTDTYQEEEPRGGNFQPYPSLPHSQGYQTAGLAQQDFYTSTANSERRHYHSNSADPYMVHEEGQGHQGNDPYGTYDQGQGHGNLTQGQGHRKLTHSGSKELEGDYRVKYHRRRELTGEEEDVSPPRGDKPKPLEEKSEDTAILDPRQYSQLQVLYKARGRKLEEITNEYEILKQDTGREIRILKHQASLANGEQEAATASLKQVQALLRDAKEDNSRLAGKNQAIESEVDALIKGRDDVMKKLHIAESNIETLNHELVELGSSDSLSRARHDHEVVIAGIQRKHQQEVKVANEKIEQLNTRMIELTRENTTLCKKLEESRLSAERAQITRAETINSLTRSLDESQKKCQALLESTSSHELSQIKITLQQTIASRKIGDDLCVTYQEEIRDLKEQLSMFESASSLGVLTTGQASSGHHQDDSLLDLGIKKTLDFDTPVSGSSSGLKGSRYTSSTSDNMVKSLKVELERCILNNKEKRHQVSLIQEELRAAKKEIDDLTGRCERSETSSADYKKRVGEWEELTRSGDRLNVVEARLKKDVDNLKREKEILLEDIEDLKTRLEEVGSSEEKLSDINRDLNIQISQMVQDFDNDKREALDRCQRTLESVHEVTKNQLRQDMEAKYLEEKAQLVNKYEEDCTNLRNELDSTLRELDEVKEMYIRVCTDKDNVERRIRTQTETEMAKQLAQMEVNMQREKEEEVERLRDEAERLREKGEKADKTREESERLREKETEVEKLRDEANRLRDEADRLREKGAEDEKLREKSERLKEKGADAEKLRDKSERLREKGAEDEKLREKSERLQEKEKEVESLKEEVERLRSECETLRGKGEEEARRLKEEAERLREDIISLREDADNNETILRDQQRKEDDHRKLLETKVALAKVAWFEEQKSAKQSAVENAIKVTENKWTTKLQDTVQSEVESRLQQAKDKWAAQEPASLETELQERLRKERQTLDERLTSEYKVHLDQEKAKLLDANELEMKRSLEREKSRAKTKTEQDIETTLKKETEKWKKKMDEEVKKKVEEERKKNVSEKRKMENEMKITLEDERKQWDSEVKDQIIEARKDWEENANVETQKKIHNEKEIWNRRKSNEIQERLEEERISLLGDQEKHLKEKIEKERVKWEGTLAEMLSQEKEKWTKERSAEMEEGKERMLEQARCAWEESHDLDVDEIRNSMEEQIQERISAEVTLAIEDAKKEWTRDHESNLTSELTDSILSDAKEIDRLKADIDCLQQETRQKDEAWRKEKAELCWSNDAEIKAAINETHEQCEREYKKLTVGHHDTLTQTLKASREQHTREKVELERRHREEVAILKVNETRLQEKLQSLGIEEPVYTRSIEKEREMFEREKWRLEQEVQERDALLEKADFHLSQEVDKLRSELESAYQQRLEAETMGLKQKFELELTRPEQKDKIVLETEIKRLKDENNRMNQEYKKLLVEHEILKSENQKRLVEFQTIRSDSDLVNDENKKVKAEVQKVKAKMFEETQRYVKEVQNMNCKMAEQSQLLSDLQAQKEELSSTKSVCQSLVRKHESLLAERQALIEEKAKILAEMGRLKSENEDLSKLKIEVAKLHAEAEVLAKLRSDVEHLEMENEQISHLKANIHRLELENSSISKLKAQVQRLEAETEVASRLKVDVARLEAENSNITALNSEVDRLQTEVGEVNTLRSEVTTLRSQVKMLEKEQENMASMQVEIYRLTSDVENMARLKSEVQHLQEEIARHQEKGSKVEREKGQLMENIRDMESAYRKDMVSQKQKQDDLNTRLKQAEKNLKDAKQHYRAQIEKLKKSLEMENNMTMETMKDKMVEMQKAHLLAVNAMKKQYKTEVEGVRSKVRDQAPPKDLSSVLVQTEDEADDEHGVMELRQQYLDTVDKIKDDVMRHITETNLRAAETVRSEMAQERNTTLTQLKRIYMENVRKILRNEIMGANVEAKLADIEQALDVISFDKPNSRSDSPASSRSSTPTPRQEIEVSHNNDSNSMTNQARPGRYGPPSHVNGIDQNGGAPRGIQTDRAFHNNSERNHNNYVSSHSYSIPTTDRQPPARPHSGHSSERYQPSSMLPPRDPGQPRFQPKEVTFSQDDRHSRTKSLPGSRIQSNKFVSFRPVSPMSSSDNSDVESFITTRPHRSSRRDHRNNKPSNRLSPSGEQRLSSLSGSSFVAVDPRPQNSSLHGSLYKTVSEPELGAEQQHSDYRFSNYKYTSLRDGLGKFRSLSPGKDSTSASHDDIHTYTDVDDRKAYSIDIGLHNLELDRTSPRKFNPSPERLNSGTHGHDAGESPTSTPRRAPKVTDNVSSSSGQRRREIAKSNLWDTEQQRYYTSSYRYQEPVKHLVEKYQGLSSKN